MLASGSACVAAGQLVIVDDVVDDPEVAGFLMTCFADVRRQD